LGDIPSVALRHGYAAFGLDADEPVTPEAFLVSAEMIERCSAVSPSPAALGRSPRRRRRRRARGWLDRDDVLLALSLSSGPECFAWTLALRLLDTNRTK
jgi:hypothetical protein